MVPKNATTPPYLVCQKVNRSFDTPLAEAEGILNSAADLKMFCPYGNT